jgi:Uma2 family endonuclease
MSAVHQPPPLAEELPDHKQLPCKDDQPVRSSQEPPQGELLTSSLEPVLQQLFPTGNYFIGQDVGIYWERTTPAMLGCRSPDWYLVPDVPAVLNGEPRRSYVLWMELVAPLFLLEFVSGNGDEERDATPHEGKFWIYERRIRADYYGIYEPERGRVQVHRLNGGRFEPMIPNERGHFPVPALGVELGIWHGRFRNIELPWLRWWNSKGELLLNAEERAQVNAWEKQQAQLRAERERQEKEQAQQQAERERLEKEQARQQAECERLEKEQAQLQTERERLEKEKAQLRVQRLREQLRALGVEPENGE